MTARASFRTGLHGHSAARERAAARGGRIDALGGLGHVDARHAQLQSPGFLRTAVACTGSMRPSPAAPTAMRVTLPSSAAIGTPRPVAAVHRCESLLMPRLSPRTKISPGLTRYARNSASSGLRTARYVQIAQRLDGQSAAHVVLGQEAHERARIAGRGHPAVDVDVATPERDCVPGNANHALDDHLRSIGAGHLGGTEHDQVTARRRLLPQPYASRTES